MGESPSSFRTFPVFGGTIGEYCPQRSGGLAGRRNFEGSISKSLEKAKV